jgi:hypothetical protein
MLCGLPHGLAQAIERRIAAEYCDRVNNVAEHLIAIEGYAS